MRKFLKKITSALLLSAWALFCTVEANASVQVNDFRIGNQSDGVRVVFDMNQSVNYRVFLLDSPQRLVIDLDNTL